MNTKCPACGLGMFVHGTRWRFSPTKTVQCTSCNHEFDPVWIGGTGRSENQRRSRDQEKKAARRYNVRRQPGSGSSSRAKGDLHKRKVLRGECKETVHKSFALKLSELVKLEKEAGGIELPLFEVKFTGVSPAKTYVVIPADWFQALRDQVEGESE